MKPRSLLFFLVLSCLQAMVQAAPTITCHLHVPGDDMSSESKPSIIPSVGNADECEQLNQQSFAGKGRCHCSFDSIRQRGFYMPEGPAGPERVLP